MTSSHIAHRIAVMRIDELQREAVERGRAKEAGRPREILTEGAVGRRGLQPRVRRVRYALRGLV